MIKYEYYTVANSTYLGDKILNKLGEEGWELVTHVHEDRVVDHIYTFKREKIAYPRAITNTLTAYQGEDPLPLYDGRTGEQVNKKK
jgi:hypothetical protein